MNQECLPIYGRARFLPAILGWVALFIIGLGLIGVMEYLETQNLIEDVPLEQLFSYKLIRYANLLLIVSTILYVANIWFAAHAVGLWATGLTTVGGFGLVVGLVVRGMETYFMHRTGHLPLASLYEVMSLFSAITVAIYLVIERVYRTRAAGAFVMPIVAIVVLFGSWLASNDQVTAENHFPILRSYWGDLQMLAYFIGYGAFAMAAAMGVMYLQRHEIERTESHLPAQGFVMRSLPDLPSIDRLMHQAIFMGFLLFSVATMLDIASANAAWDAKEIWTLIVWVMYVSYFYLHYVKKWHGVRIALWAVIWFGLSIFFFLGVKLYCAAVHSYG